MGVHLVWSFPYPHVVGTISSYIPFIFSAQKIFLERKYPNVRFWHKADTLSRKISDAFFHHSKIRRYYTSYGLSEVSLKRGKAYFSEDNPNLYCVHSYNRVIFFTVLIGVACLNLFINCYIGIF